MISDDKTECKERKLKGAYFFVVFFLLFASAILFIPTPMFPGDILVRMADLAGLAYASVLSALINALVYGLVAWAIFVFVMRRIENSSVSKQSVEKSKKRK
jgi:hypothetical protein